MGAEVSQTSDTSICVSSQMHRACCQHNDTSISPNAQQYERCWEMQDMADSLTDVVSITLLLSACHWVFYKHTWQCMMHVTAIPERDVSIEICVRVRDCDRQAIIGQLGRKEIKTREQVEMKQ